MTQPMFLIIGPPRSATTWLTRELCRQPRVFIPRGECPFFVRQTTGLDYRARLDEAVFKKKLAARPGPGDIVGEKNPNYLAMPTEIIASCATLFPDARLICCVRDPVARAWSDIRLRASKAGEDPAEWLGWPPGRRNRVISPGRYRFHLDRWARFYPADRFLLVSFEEIQTDPGAVIGRALGHIGAPRTQLRPIDGAVRTRVGPPPPPRVVEQLEREYAGQRWDLDYLAWTLAKIARSQPARARLPAEA